MLLNHLVDLSIAHQLLSRVLGVEAVASKDLDAVGGGLVGDVAGEALRDGGVQGVPLAHVGLMHTIVRQKSFPNSESYSHELYMYLPSRLHVCKPSTLGVDGHVGEHGGDRLVMNGV